MHNKSLVNIVWEMRSEMGLSNEQWENLFSYASQNEIIGNELHPGSYGDSDDKSLNKQR